MASTSKDEFVETDLAGIWQYYYSRPNCDPQMWCDWLLLWKCLIIIVARSVVIWENTTRRWEISSSIQFILLSKT